MTTLQSLNINIEVLNELINAQSEGRTPKTDIIKNYIGFGAIKEISYDITNDDHWNPSNKKIRSLLVDLYEKLSNHYGPSVADRTFESMRSSTLTAFYTPELIVNPIVDFFDKLAIKENKVLNVLDPSSGTGAFVAPLLNLKSINSVTSIEKDLLTSTIQKHIYSDTKTKFHAGPFEKIINTTNYENSTFDLIISNIPFGDIKVFDPIFNKLPNQSPEFNSQNSIHGYFFQKSISKLNAGGYIGFITSTSIADSINNDYLRKDILKKCKLIQIIRLPNNTFDNTKVVSDLIILKRRNRTLTTLNDLNKEEQKFLKTETIKVNDGLSTIKYESQINSYFLDENKNLTQNVLGYLAPGYLHNRPTVTLNSNLTLKEIGEKITDNLNTVLELKVAIIPEKKETPTIPLEKIQFSLFDEIETAITKNNITVKNPILDRIDISDIILKKYLLVEGNVFKYKDDIGTIQFGSNGAYLKPLIGKTQLEKNKLLLASEILLTYKKLIFEDLNNPMSNDAVLLRQTLNIKYDAFVNQYKQISLKENRALILTVEKEGFKLQSLENYNEKTFFFDKSDIFNQSSFNDIQIKEYSLEDAVNKSLNINSEINIDFISQLYNKPNSEVIYEGLTKELFFINPKTNQNFDITQQYKSLKDSDKAAGFNFVTKDELIAGPLRFKITEMEQNPDWYLNPAIYDKTLELLEKNKIDIVPIVELQPKIGENWIPKNHFEHFASQLFDTDILINKSSYNGSYTVKKPSYSYKANKDFAIDCKNGKTITAHKLLENALHGAIPKITYTVKEGDTKKTYLDREAMSKAQMKIDTINDEWSSYVLANKELGVELENRYNNVQNINVERVFNGTHLELPNLEFFNPFDHQKNCTWQLLNNNGGLADHIVGAGKSLIIAMTTMEMKRLKVAEKTMITGLKANIMDIYKDFVKAYPEAKVLFPSDKDFEPNNRKMFIQKIQNNHWDAVILSHEQFSSIPQSRDIQEKIINEELHNIRLDLNDAISTGEAQANKRVFTTLQKKLENKEVMLLKLADSIKKDPNLVTFDKLGIDHLIVDESHVFKNLEFSTRHMNVAGLGSPEGSARALNMLFAVRTLQEKHQGDKGVSFFTGTPISNSLAELYLLKKFLNPSELIKRDMPNFDTWARTYAELTRDFELSVTNEIKAKERYRSFQKVPELARWYRSFSNIANENNIILDRPSLENHLIVIKDTPLQKEYSKELINAVYKEDFSFFGSNFSKEQMSAKMLIATNISTKISMDVRMIDPNLDQIDGSKAVESCKNIAMEYDKSNSFKGTQLVFCDTNTPNADKNKFTIYNAIKNTLVHEYGIPENEIKFIHDFNTKKAKSNLFKDVNDGKVRVLLGSTSKMGVGVNAQKKIIAMHHLDIPWSPKDLLQRNGRGERQGNIAAKLYNNNIVNNYIYATEGTLDSYKYYLVDTKQKFINQIKDSNSSTRNIDEGEMGDDGVLSASAFIAQLSGKQELLEKNKIDKQLNEFELKRSVLIKDVIKIKNEIDYSQKIIPKIAERKQLYQKDLIQSNLSFNQTEKGIKFSLNIGEGKELKDKEKITNHLITNINKFLNGKESVLKVGEIGEFNVLLNGYLDSSEKEPKTYVRLVLESKTTNLEYLYGTGIVSEERPVQLYKQIFDSVKQLQDKINDQERSFKSQSELLEKNLERLPKINANIYDEQIQTLKQNSLELAMIIEGETDKLNLNLGVIEELNQCINSNKRYDLEKCLSTLKVDQKLTAFELIFENTILAPDKKEELLYQFVFDKDLKNVINSIQRNEPYETSIYSTINKSKDKTILKYQVEKSTLNDTDKATVFKMLKIEMNPIVTKENTIKNNNQYSR